MNKLCPEKLFSEFLPRSSVSKYKRHCLQIPRYRIEFVSKSFHLSALKAWNDTTAELRELPTQNSFKKTEKISEGLDLEVTTRIPGTSALFYRVKFLFKFDITIVKKGDTSDPTYFK